jgi:hypothetical protein
MEYATQNNSPAQVNLDIFPAQYANGQPAYSNTSLFVYGITNATGNFIPTEKISVNANTYMYLKEGNSTYLYTSAVNGTIANTNFIYGDKSGSTANVISVGRIPVHNLANSSLISSNTDYGFIINLYENY